MAGGSDPEGCPVPATFRRRRPRLAEPGPSAMSPALGYAGRCFARIRNFRLEAVRSVCRCPVFGMAPDPQPRWELRRRSCGFGVALERQRKAGPRGKSQRASGAPVARSRPVPATEPASNGPAPVSRRAPAAEPAAAFCCGTPHLVAESLRNPESPCGTPHRSSDPNPITRGGMPHPGDTPRAARGARCVCVSTTFRARGSRPQRARPPRRKRARSVNAQGALDSRRSAPARHGARVGAPVPLGLRR